MEVRCDASGRQISVHRVDPRDPPTLGVETPELEEVEDEDQQLLDSWSLVDLPDSLILIPAPEEDDDDLFSRDGFDVDLEGSSARDEDPWPEATRLVLLVPDGTAISIEDFALRSSEGWRRLRVDPWTASMTLESPPPAGERIESEEPIEDDPDLESDPTDEEAASPDPDPGVLP